ncbi:preprotein translocase subunit SecG [Spiroplasma endosymbiont of Agriotes lineatus]|uniref:preprotein translocase subunit SecG n=1 Tax=Spiroplasma endosymbiont of Agriotes lineatus TaxID=3077930 RepID=UPI0030D23F64
MSKQNILLIFEIILLIIGFAMIVIGLLQSKKTQSGLGALSGGNQELFAQTKERGLSRTLSFMMLGCGTCLFVLSMIIRILENTL